MNILSLSPDEQDHLEKVEAYLSKQIAEAGGMLPFDLFMESALYAPGLGYYVAGSRKFGSSGDFVTAPEISPFFSRCLAAQCAQVLNQLSSGSVLEVGAGSGVMAAELLLELERLGALPERYLMLELSPDLQQRQQHLLAERVPEFMDRIFWLTSFPDPGFQGVVLGNELLDAMPVHLFRSGDSGLEELFVTRQQDKFVSSWREAENPALVNELMRIQKQCGSFAAGYRSEVNLRLKPWMKALGDCVQRGAVILVDYGYTRREYYHPDRTTGTLICHFRHHAHDDPLKLTGMQDITANVDFTAVAEAGLAAGFKLSGYTTQANFLLGCGLDKILLESETGEGFDYIKALQGIKQLTLPSEMGERFKVIGLTKGMDTSMKGFDVRDLSSRL